MSDSPPTETPTELSQPHSQETPQEKEKQEQEKDQEQTDPPNPNQSTDFKAKNLDKSEPSTPETQNPLAFTQEQQNSPRDLPNLENQDQEEPHLVEEDQEQEDDPDFEITDGMDSTLSPKANASVSDTHFRVGGRHKAQAAPSSARRGAKRKKGGSKGGSHKAQAALEKKLVLLRKGFKAVPFVPGKVLDFSKHEENLKRLGLWEFAHIEFDRSLRTDLIMMVVASYSQKDKSRYFWVNGCRIGVNRADLGRALKLPSKKTGESDGEGYPQEFLSFLDEFVCTWMLLHENEDLWCTPKEIVDWTTLMKDGHPEKVDWPGLVWYMVEKELAQGVNLKECYYASHLQHLIKTQKKELLEEMPKVEVVIDEDEDGSDVRMLDLEESSLVGLGQKREERCVELSLGQSGSASVVNVDDTDKVKHVSDAEKVENTENVEKVGDAEKVEKAGVGGEQGEDHNSDEIHEAEDLGNAENVICDADPVVKVEADEQMLEDEHREADVECAEQQVGDVDMDVGQDENVDNAENAEGGNDLLLNFGYHSKVEQGQWLSNGLNDRGQHFLQRCSVTDEKFSIDETERLGDDMEDPEGEQDGHVEGFEITDNSHKGSYDGISSALHMPSFQTAQFNYSSAQLGGPSSLDLMSCGTENNLMLGGPSMFHHAVKREISPDHDLSGSTLNISQKRLRVGDSWDDKSPGTEVCLDNVEKWLRMTRASQVNERKSAYQQQQATENQYGQQIAIRDEEIMQLKYRLIELEKQKHAEANRLNRELFLMSNVVDGYRRALKETQRKFSEYRKRYGVRDIPIYKDAGSGGVVKSVMELERERVKQEQERQMICNQLEQTYRDCMVEFESKWEEFGSKIQSLDDRLQCAEVDFEQLMVRAVKPKASDVVQNDDESSPPCK